MEKKEYIQLLESAYDNLPKVLHKSSRFEIPKVRGRLVKTRTIISNGYDIANDFSRDINHFFKFLLKEVGVRGELRGKGEIILFSRFQPSALNKAVSSYFKQFVECQHCNSPDSTLDEETGILKCKACGHEGKRDKLKIKKLK